MTPTGTPAGTGCRAASAPRRFAPAVRVGLPSNRSPQQGTLTAGEPPNVCTRMSSRLRKLSTAPLHALDAVLCTDLCGQHPQAHPAASTNGTSVDGPVDHRPTEESWPGLTGRTQGYRPVVRTTSGWNDVAQVLMNVSGVSRLPQTNRPAPCTCMRLRAGK